MDATYVGSRVSFVLTSAEAGSFSVFFHTPSPRAEAVARPWSVLMRRLSLLFSLLALLSLTSLSACDDDPTKSQPAVAPSPEGAPAAEEPSTAPPVASESPASGEDRPGSSARPGDPATAPTAPAPAPSAETRENDERARIEGALSLPLYPGAHRVLRLSKLVGDDRRLVLSTDDPARDVVRFYEKHTGKMAQTTELSDGTIYDIVLDSAETETEGRLPLRGVQVRTTPEALRRDGVVGKTSVILFRRKHP